MRYKKYMPTSGKKKQEAIDIQIIVRDLSDMHNLATGPES